MKTQIVQINTQYEKLNEILSKINVEHSNMMNMDTKYK